MATVRIVLPPLFAERTGGVSDVPLEAETLAEALQRLAEAYPDVRPLLFSKAGEPNDFLVVFHNGQRVESPADAPLFLDPGDEIVLVSAVEGGYVSHFTL